MILQDVSLVALLDIALTALPLYVLILTFRQAHSSRVLAGILIAGVWYVVARLLGLQLLSLLLQGFFAVFLIAAVVIFQEELRRVFEGIAQRVLPGLYKPRSNHDPRRKAGDLLVKLAGDLARDRIGALLVVQGADPVDRHLSGGTALNGDLSEPLLKSLFDPHSIGHDGAVVLRGSSVARFGCHLPLSHDLEQLGDHGTRHAAALGLAERCDALCLVVSEERGTVSVAQDERLEEITDLTALAARLDGFARRGEPAAERPSWRDNLALKAGALLLAVLMWFFLIHESAVEYRSFTVPIQTAGAPDGSTATVQPARARIIVQGARRDFYFVRANDLDLTVKLFDLEPTSQEIMLTASEVKLPPGLEFVNIVPRLVMLELEARSWP